MRFAEETSINRLRIRTRGGGVDPISARSRPASLLSSVTLHPSGLPPSAIVCIRRLQDPRPGALRLSKTGMRPPRVWEEALTSSIDGLARRAMRPALGYVPVDTEAVLFLDRSELLAGLARDWSQGMTNQWWWKSLFRNPVTTGMLMRELLETPEYCPGALRILAEQGKAASFASKLSRNEAVALVRGMTQKFGLSNLQAALNGQFVIEEKNRAESKEDDKENEAQSSSSGAVITLDLTEERSERGSEVSGINTIRQAPAKTGSFRPPWLRFAPESASLQLSPEHQILIGTGLMLTRVPAEIRKKSFAEAICLWKTAITAVSMQISKLSEKSLAVSKAESEESNSRDVSAPYRHSGLDTESSDFSRKPLDSRFRGNDERIHSTIVGVENYESRKEVFVAGTDTSSSVETGSGARDIPSAEQPRAVEAVQPDLLNEVVIQTELGGLFYLINLGLYLGLYGDFTTPRAPGIDLDIWDFVTLLGRELMNDAVPNDPVWPLLATFAGRREGEAPGTGFDPPDEWRLPPAWLEAFADESLWRWDTQEERLKVVHGSGFPVLDVLRTDENAEDQVEREMREYKSIASFTLKHGPVATDAEHDGLLEIWLSRLVPYVQARLMRALGHSTGEKLSMVLFRHRARVHVTETHLDVHFDLADLPIEIRIAGLDRDPGWVPAAGRYVKFHYE